MEVLWWQSGASSHANALHMTPPSSLFLEFHNILGLHQFGQYPPFLTQKPKIWGSCHQHHSRVVVIQSTVILTGPGLSCTYCGHPGWVTMNMLIVLKTSNSYSCIVLTFLSRILFSQQSSWGFFLKELKKMNTVVSIWHIWHPYFPWTIYKREE